MTPVLITLFGLLFAYFTWICLTLATTGKDKDIYRSAFEAE